MKTILVTGGAGYVGSCVIRALLKENYNVVCVDKLAFGGQSLLGVWSESSFHFHSCDINDHDQFSKILSSYKIDGVIHLAAIVGDPACKREPELATMTNWTTSKWLLDECIKRGIPRFIFASTCSNYGKMSDPGAFVDENSELSPVSLYAELKVQFEQYLLEGCGRPNGFAPTSLRFSTVYGISPRMRFDLTVNEFTKELVLGKELVVFGEQFWRPYCHVTDFARAFIAVLQSPEERIAYDVFNVGDTRENYTKKMLVDEIAKVVDGPKIKFVHKDEDPRDYRVNSDKIKRELGFEISMRVPDGIREIKRVLELDVIRDPENQRFYNIPHTV